MAKVVKQYRYYNETDQERNQPLGVKKEEFINGSVFENPSCYPILQLGIQTLPGTKFYLNNSVEPIIVGFTGIYELDLDGLTEIIRLTFNKTSMDMIDENPNGYLIVDVLYDNGEGDV